MRRLGAILALAAAAALAAASCSPQSARIVVAAGTTVVDSGFVDRLAAAFEADHPDVTVSVVGESTLFALELGRRGAADVTITHAPLQEAEFLQSGEASSSSLVFSSAFILAGPAELADLFAGYELPEALRVVVASEIPFVSRGDGSGTHEKEMENWLEAGLRPGGASWYVETGQGMGPTLLVADQRGALTLAELGAFRAAEPTIGLIDMRLDPGALDNPYTAMVMASSSRPLLARLFVDWLVSPAGVAAIERANTDLFGAIVYTPAEGG